MSDEENVRLHALIDGHVQGVGFRAFVRTIADSQALTGWVRNTSEGLVEVLAEGPRENLEILLDYIRRGPRSAFVTNVQQEWSEASGEFLIFDITRTV